MFSCTTEYYTVTLTVFNASKVSRTDLPFRKVLHMNEILSYHSCSNAKFRGKTAPSIFDIDKREKGREVGEEWEIMLRELCNLKSQK